MTNPWTFRGLLAGILLLEDKTYMAFDLYCQAFVSNQEGDEEANYLRSLQPFLTISLASLLIYQATIESL